MKETISIILIITTCVAVSNALPSEFSNYKSSKLRENASKKEIDLQYEADIASPQLKLLRKHASVIKEYQLNNNDSSPEARMSILEDISCTACNFAIGLLQFYLSIGLSDKAITNHMSSVCSTFHIESGEVCDGIIHMFGPEILYLLRHISISPSQACGFILENTCPDEYSPYHDWNIYIPPETKKTPQNRPIPKENAPRLKVLQLSDSHYDPEYTEGTNAYCERPLCCRANSGQVMLRNDRAGKWGHYGKCDTPKRTIDHLLDHIAQVHPDIDYILWTGDLPPHNVWDQTKSYNLNIIKESAKQLSEKFPKIPIFPALGNHESAPVNTFPPHYLDPAKISSAWLYNELDTIWKDWLPANVSETVRRGAFYSILLKPGFRIISLNMNYCNNKNFWLMMNTTDPDEELQWLIDELERSEGMNEKVHVIGHIPPGNADCLKVWSRNFYKVIARYENTIMAQFYGHTHFDEMELFYDPENLERPTSIAYIGPSVTPYVALNPGYRIYYVDGDHNETTRMVVDHETWIMDLQKANENDNPVWYKLYSAKEAYGMSNLRAEDWNELVNSMENDEELFQLYYKHYWKDSPLRPNCDAGCKNYLLCSTKCGRSYDRNRLCSKKGRSKVLQMDKKKVKENVNSWTQSLRVGLSSVYNLVSHVQKQTQLLTNELDPLNLYEEL